MLRNDKCLSARDLLEQLTTRLCRQRGIDAEARAPIRLPTLQRMMHDIGEKHDLACSAARDAHTEHSRRVSRRWTKGQAVAEIGVHLDKIYAAGLKDRKAAVCPDATGQIVALVHL